MSTQPSTPPEYKPTLFDRHGAAASDLIHAGGYGISVFGLAFGAFALAGGGISVISTVLAAVAGAAVSGASLWFARMAGEGTKAIMMGSSSTPYKEQYSYQQALVMAGKLDEALESFEAVIAESPTNIDARMRAAELYAREKKDAKRAAELFREVQRIPEVTTGEDIYVSNRLVDLLAGPLADPGRALVELRRLIERYPNLPAIAHARDALARLKHAQVPDER